MARPSRVTVAALVAAASIGHVVYPAWLALVSRRRAVPHKPSSTQWPAVTVLVAAYREAEGIAIKVRDVLDNGYPGALEVIVVADGDVETAARAEEAGATVITSAERLGKAQALNLGFSKASTPIVVVSDADNTLSPGCISLLVGYFEDPRVGAVAGEKVELDGGGEGLYWRFESWLKRREWRLGTTIGLVGELAAIRSDAWQPIPVDIATDDLWTALDLSARGYVIAYEERARAFEPPVPTLRDQWERRTRSVSGAMHVFARRRRQLGPGGGLAAAEIWGHRLARYTVAPLAHLALLSLALRRVRTSRLAMLFLGAHVTALWGLARKAGSRGSTSSHVAGDDASSARAVAGARLSARRAPATVADALGQAVFLNAVALGGLYRYVRGDRRTKWPVAGQDS
jgi:cellulose synthase/poly-beta-1,6-N-acetylglucosamine synthase-like glycosyltransferase